jgi:hypothetical protein
LSEEILINPRHRQENIKTDCKEINFINWYPVVYSIEEEVVTM